MDLVLLDTDVFSFFFRADTRASLYQPDVNGKVRCLSFASVAELRFGALIGGWGESRRRDLEESIATMVVLPCDDPITGQWAQIKAMRQRAGSVIASEDCWIAATALRHQIPLLTHNSKDFQHIEGLTVITHSQPGK